ncbi:hypothetical protein GCM10011506_24370 [Marivirga lumbricoides]|uniref:DUF2254 domain-containing protein n=1 Tax=Marivirga lumbricoides TaxID=1046115 RepID=A0ABQ1MF05_9BACT|nr:hypothetical protein GCM10011506_24370 [Marivirga lumbricoides]
MKIWFKKLKRVYLSVINSIAFYPSLLTVFFFFVSFIVIQIEFKEIVIDFKENISPVLVHSSDNARLILGTIVGSLISLMVFSFSMVMVVLNSATATLSPRVLPGLISNKFHQIVLGFYIGSIIFSLNLIVNIDSPDIEYATPSLGIFFSMLLSIICLGLFVYFIHSISQQIQVDNIMNNIYKSTQTEIERLETADQNADTIDTENWIEHRADTSGYLKLIDYEGLQHFCQTHHLKIKVNITLGDFVTRHYPFLQTNLQLDEEKKKNLMSNFILYTQERVADHFSFGFKQISEIAVKALSPGINDPGTAKKAIDLLSDLFIQMMFIKEKNYLTDEEDQVCVYLNPITYEDLLYKTLIPIREYGSSDIMIFMALLDCMARMLYVDGDRHEYSSILQKFIQNLVDCSAKHVNNPLDKDRINRRIVNINNQLPSKLKIEAI